MGETHSKSYNVAQQPEVMGFKRKNNVRKKKGVFYAFQQKLRPRRKSHAKKEIKTCSNETTVQCPDDSSYVDDCRSNGNELRQRVFHGTHCVDKKKKGYDMGLQQSKQKVKITERAQINELDYRKENTNESYQKNSEEHFKEKSIVIIAKEKQKLSNTQTAVSKLVSSTSQNIVEKKKSFEDIYRKDQNEQNEEKIPSLIYNTEATFTQDSIPTEQKEYLTIEECIVHELYDDGTQVTKTTITEIPCQSFLKNNQNAPVKAKIIEKVEDIKSFEKLEKQNFTLSGHTTDFAHEMSSGIIVSVNKAKTSVSSFVHSDAKKSLNLSDFKLFVINKYAEKITKFILQSSYTETILFKKRNVSSLPVMDTDIVVNNIIGNEQENTDFNKHKDLEQNHKSRSSAYKSNLNIYANNIAALILPDQIFNDVIKTTRNKDFKKETEIVKDEIKNITPVNTESCVEKYTDSVSGACDMEIQVKECPEYNKDMIVQNGVNKTLTFTVSDKRIKVDTDSNENVVVRRRPQTVASDRPLSGFAEKLAELLAEEDDELDFLDSDEDLNESLDKIKTSYGPKRRISIEVSNFQHQFSVNEINDISSKTFKSKVDLKRNDRRNRFKAKGDRPISLYAQDMLADILNDDNESFSEDETEDVDDSVVEDVEMCSVKETAVMLENAIPFAPVNRTFTLNTDYELVMDEVMRSRKQSSVTNPESRIAELGKAVVMDLGSGVLKAGFCGDTKPTCYCPSVIGVPRRFSQDASKMKKAVYVGDEAWSMAGMLQIEHPIRQNISNWSDVESIIEYVLDEELKVRDNEHPVLLTEMSLTSNKHREKLTELMFEKFGVPAYYLANQAALSMYSMGLTTGLCLSSGFCTTQVVPIYEGYALPYATVQLDIGGDHVTKHLGRMMLGNYGQSFSSSSEKLILNAMKQSLCYLSSNVISEQAKYKTNVNMYQNYTLPDGQEINLGTEMFLAPEILFDPALLGLHQPSTSECVTKSLSIVDSDITHVLADNLLVTGGNTKLNGYSTRLEHELLREINNGGPEITVKYADDPILSSWIGGSIMSSIPAFRDQWIKLEQYAETGSKIVHSICF